MNDPHPDEHPEALLKDAQPEELPTIAEADALPLEEETPRMSPRLAFTLGVIFMLLSGLGFAAQGLFVGKADQVHSLQKTMARNVILFAVSFVLYIHQRRKEARPRPKHPEHRKLMGILLLRSLMGTLGVIANFYALSHIPIANAQLLNKLSPFFTIIFTALFLKQKVNKVQILGIATAFIGVVVLLNPDASGFTEGQLLPMLIGVAGGIFAGAAYTSVHYLTHQGMDSSFIIAFFGAFGAISMLPLVIPVYTAMTSTEWFYMLMIGICALIGQYGITYAYRFAEPRRISIFDYSAVIFSVLLGFFFLDQVPSSSAILGNVIIFAAFLMMFIYNRRTASRERRVK